MDTKKKNIIIAAIVAICVVLVVVLFVTRTSNDEGYEYEGYVIAVLPDGKDTRLTTINAQGQSEFVLKKNSKKEFKTSSNNVSAGDYIQLNTKKNSETEIKNCLVFTAFSSTGKIVNVEGESAPFLITTTSSNSLRMYKLIPAEGSIPAMPTGTPVKIYYQYELNNATTQVVTDVIYPLSDTTTPLTEGEIFHIEKVQNYTLAGSKAE